MTYTTKETTLFKLRKIFLVLQKKVMYYNINDDLTSYEDNYQKRRLKYTVHTAHKLKEMLQQGNNMTPTFNIKCLRSAVL
jgi:hypothetical protein